MGLFFAEIPTFAIYIDKETKYVVILFGTGTDRSRM